jgi:hypothetical protein
MRGLVVRVVLVLWALVLPTDASAQYPTNLSICLPGPTDCQIPVRGVGAVCTSHTTLFFSFLGNVVWGLLQSVGPVTIEVETITPPDTQFPIYVEIVPVNDPYDVRVCAELRGYVVGIVYGHPFDPCGNWDEIGPIDITTVIPVGSLYALRLRFLSFFPIAFAPALRCLRLKAYPEDSTPIAPATWARVKQLYR